MKLRACICGLIVVSCSLPALAGKPARGRKGGGQNEANPPSAPTSAVVNPGELPSVTLARFIGMHLSRLSSLSPETEAISAPYRNDISLMRALFQAGLNSTVPEKKPIYQGALAVCDTLVVAIDEHDKAAANFAASKQVHGVPDVKNEKITTLRARHGYGRATRANNRQENVDNNRAAAGANANDAFLNSAVTNAWTTRLTQLRQQIDAAYARELTLEQQSATPSSATPTPAR